MIFVNYKAPLFRLQSVFILSVCNVCVFIGFEFFINKAKLRHLRLRQLATKFPRQGMYVNIFDSHPFALV